MVSIVKVDQIKSSDGTTEYLNAGNIKNATLDSSVTNNSGVASGAISSNATFPAGMPIKVYNKTMARDSSVYSQSTSYFEPGSTIDNGEFTLTCTPATAGNKFLVMVSYMPGFKAPSSDDMQGFVELYGGLTSSQSQLWEVEMRTDNMGKLGDYLNHMPYAVVRNFQFTTPSVAEHTFKVRCKAGSSARWIYYQFNGGDITIMEIQG
tara:strand:- start:46 stop:666 length:621 start_codon:yes stop_codon:yes gene_type:complete